MLGVSQKALLPMIDLLFLGITAAFFILCGWYAHACETL